MEEFTVVGGGLTGLVASIECAEGCRRSAGLGPVPDMNVCTKPFVRPIHDIRHGELTTIFTTELFAASIHSWMRTVMKREVR
jgi:hypothetical protein